MLLPVFEAAVVLIIQLNEHISRKMNKEIEW